MAWGGGLGAAPKSLQTWTDSHIKGGSDGMIQLSKGGLYILDQFCTRFLLDCRIVEAFRYYAP